MPPAYRTAPREITSRGASAGATGVGGGRPHREVACPRLERSWVPMVALMLASAVLAGVGAWSGRLLGPRLGL